MPVSNELLDAENIPPSGRDYCAHILIPLQRCRRDTFYVPWKCQHLRHMYDKCQFVE